MQKVVASRDVEIRISFDALSTPYKLATGTTLMWSISGNTEDIYAISSADPIGEDNGNTVFDLDLSLQTAEWLDIKDALAAATATSAEGSIAHIRQIVEGAQISVSYNKRRDVPAKVQTETFTFCTGVSENGNTDRSSVETISALKWKARGLSRATGLL